MSDFKPPSPVYLGPARRSSSGSNKPIKRIVMHGTVSPTVRGQARATAAYFRGTSAGGSAHYVVDPGEVVQVAYDSVIAWHAPPNSNSLGVELCDWVGKDGKALPLSRWEGADHKAMLKLAARLVAELCLAYDVPPLMLGPGDLKAGRRGICEHSDVSEAFRQSSHWDCGNFPRKYFERLVQAEVKALRTDDKPATVNPPTGLSKARELLEQALRNARKAGRKRRIDKALKSLPKR